MIPPVSPEQIDSARTFNDARNIPEVAEKTAGYFQEHTNFLVDLPADLPDLANRNIMGIEELERLVGSTSNKEIQNSLFPSSSHKREVSLPFLVEQKKISQKRKQQSSKKANFTDEDRALATTTTKCEWALYIKSLAGIVNSEPTEEEKEFIHEKFNGGKGMTAQEIAIEITNKSGKDPKFSPRGRDWVISYILKSMREEGSEFSRQA